MRFLVSAVGDLHNTMSLATMITMIAPSKDGKSRNIVSNIWDWDVAASWDDGAYFMLRPSERL